jgi:pimeloyl-ACP methyl ester carboxylesterase
MHEEAQQVLPAVCAELGLDKPYLIGHSDGASIAFIYAACFPEHLSGMCLMAPHLFCEPMCVAAIERAKAEFEHSDWPIKMRKYHIDPEATFYAWADVWLHPRFRAWDLRAYLPFLAAHSDRILALQGAEDPYGTPAHISVFAAHRLIANCQHSPHLEHPLQVLNALEAHYMRVCGEIKT